MMLMSCTVFFSFGFFFCSENYEMNDNLAVTSDETCEIRFQFHRILHHVQMLCRFYRHFLLSVDCCQFVMRF